MLKVNQLTKNYGSLTALDQLTLDLPKGRIGLLGPNGAGKSTFIKVVLGLLQPSDGSAEVLGHPVGPESIQLRKKVGYMPEHDCLPDDVAGIDFVANMGQLSGMPRDEAMGRAHEVLQYLRMGEERYREIGSYSGGMRQKVKLAQALVHSPELVLADEPTTGLDPIGREEMLQMLKELSTESGMSIIVSTHLLPDVEYLCDRVVIIDDGRLLSHSTVAELLGFQEEVVEVHTDMPEQMATLLKQDGFKTDLYGDELHIHGDDIKVKRKVIELAAKNGWSLRHMAKGVTRLEESYLDLVKQKRGDGK